MSEAAKGRATERKQTERTVSGQKAAEAKGRHLGQIGQVGQSRRGGDC
ncbi:MAG: hypothetical protein JW947_10110 [Sedimentisphaerales bacterium]|nr:hypothetical protein [Sedimentisphaerales bacterium]